MKMPFDLTTNFNTELKESAREPDQFLKAKEFIKDELRFKEEVDASGMRDRYSLLAYICRILDQCEEAEDYAKKALDLSRKMNMILLVVIDQMRLASALGGQGKQQEAKEMFLDTIEICEKFQPLNEVIDFAYHNYARFLFEAQSFEESKLYFEKAMNVREEKDIPELLEATKFAIKIVSGKIEKH